MMVRVKISSSIYTLLEDARPIYMCADIIKIFTLPYSYKMGLLLDIIMFCFVTLNILWLGKADVDGKISATSFQSIPSEKVKYKREVG